MESEDEWLAEIHGNIEMPLINTAINEDLLDVSHLRGNRDPAQALCLGLGLRAAPLIQAFQARTDITQVELACHHATEPKTLTEWLLRRTRLGDLIVVLLDPNDPQAVQDLAMHATYWRPSEAVYCIVVVLNGGPDGSSRETDQAWRHHMATQVDAVIDVAPRSSAYQRLAVQILTDGVLMLSPNFCCYDVDDIRMLLRPKTRRHTAAAAWNRPGQCLRELERLRLLCPVGEGNNLLAFLHAGKSFHFDEFSDLIGNCSNSLALLEQTTVLVSLFLHADWPANRRVLGITL